MKNIVLVLVFTCFAIQSYAQTFAPVGSKWVYCYAVNAVGGAEGYDTLVVESVAETHFDTLPCKELRVTYCYSAGAFGCGLVSKINVCQDARKVYYQEGDSLYLLYNFGLMPGDTLRIRYPLALDTFNQQAVDSAFFANPSKTHFDIAILDTATLDLNGQKAWTQTFAEAGNEDSFQPSWYSGQFWEDIGSTAGWLFPRAIDVLQEVHIPFNLISYTSPVLNNHFGDIGPFCKTTSTNENTPVFYAKVWPNPAKTVLHIEVPKNGETAHARIFDVSGKLLLTATNRAFDTIQVNITDLKPGIYFYEAIMPTHGISVGRFIVE